MKFARGKVQQQQGNMSIKTPRITANCIASRHEGSRLLQLNHMMQYLRYSLLGPFVSTRCQKFGTNLGMPHSRKCAQRRRCLNCSRDTLAWCSEGYQPNDLQFRGTDVITTRWWKDMSSRGQDPRMWTQWYMRYVLQVASQVCIRSCTRKSVQSEECMDPVREARTQGFAAKSPSMHKEKFSETFTIM